MKKNIKWLSIVFTLVIFINNVVLYPVYGMENKETYLVNNNNETYGNLLLAKKIGYEPDLIEAIGINGVEGYVKRNELYLDSPDNPEEAILQAENKKSRIINVYEKDGVTIVDRFLIDNSSNDDSSKRSIPSGFEYSILGPVTINGVDYATISGIRPIWRGVTGITGIYTMDGTNIPIGHVAVKVRIIKKSNGKLVAESDFKENKKLTPEHSWPLSHTSLLFNVEYYTEGFVKIFNGTNFVTYSTYCTPAVTPTWIGNGD